MRTSSAWLIIASMIIVPPLQAQSRAAAGARYVQPSEPVEDAAQRQAAAPDPVQDRVSQAAHPISLEDQVKQLQNEVAELQTTVQQLQSVMPASGDSVVTRNSPSPGMRCQSSLAPVNEIMNRTYYVADSTSYMRRPYSDDTLVMMWSNCRR